MVIGNLRGPCGIRFCFVNSIQARPIWPLMCHQQRIMLLARSILDLECMPQCVPDFVILSRIS